MECKATIKDVTPTLDGAVMVLHVANATGADELMGKELRLTLKQYYKKRSLTANNYFYALVGELADRLNVSKPYIHNLMLRKYGQIQTIDGRPIYVVIPETEETQNKVDEDEYTHLKPTAEVKIGKDGKAYRTYLMLKGSHELNSREMGLLIDGLVDDCKQQGINTMTANEIAELKQKWGVDVGQHYTN